MTSRFHKSCLLFTISIRSYGKRVYAKFRRHLGQCPIDYGTRTGTYDWILLRTAFARFDPVLSG
uniref:Uncharacterized protein n=1 Tax=Anguilla anguilla TaxID=7936 RepID=A0A0E9VLC2_ANGAN